MLSDDIKFIDDGRCLCKTCMPFNSAWERIKTALAELDASTNTGSLAIALLKTLIWHYKEGNDIGFFIHSHTLEINAVIAQQQAGA
jgi:hypothetical protein